MLNPAARHLCVLRLRESVSAVTASCAQAKQAVLLVFGGKKGAYKGAKYARVLGDERSLNSRYQDASAEARAPWIADEGGLQRAAERVKLLQSGILPKKVLPTHARLLLGCLCLSHSSALVVARDWLSLES